MTGLIIEGGARRGIFTAGITDCLLENKIHFDYVAGVSAGAEVALDFTAKQEGRSRRVIMPHRTGDFSVLGFLSMDLDNMIYRFPYQDYPFDFDTFFASDTNCEFVATDCVTGKAKYFSENKSEQRLLDSVRASCTVPILDQMIKITLTKEVGYGKENICTDLFVDIAVVALFSHRNYRHLFIY